MRDAGREGIRPVGAVVSRSDVIIRSTDMLTNVIPDQRTTEHDVCGQISEYAAGVRIRLVIFVMISLSAYPGTAFSLSHSGSARNMSQAAFRPASSGNTSR